MVLVWGRALEQTTIFTMMALLFNTVVCGPWHDAAVTRELIRRGSAKNARESLRRFLDRVENPICTYPIT